jgi:hypothetical protein
MQLWPHLSPLPVGAAPVGPVDATADSRLIGTIAAAITAVTMRPFLTHLGICAPFWVDATDTHSAEGSHANVMFQ